MQILTSALKMRKNGSRGFVRDFYQDVFCFYQDFFFVFLVISLLFCAFFPDFKIIDEFVDLMRE